MYQFNVREYDQIIDSKQEYILVADIGGTNSNFGVLQNERNQFILVLSLHLKSSEIKSFAPVIVDLLAYLKGKYQLIFHAMCIGAAGVIDELRESVKPTNLPFAINTQEIKNRTGLEYVLLINDFEAVGYGIDKISSDALVVINQGIVRNHANKAVIGAGTGLGKGILGWDENINHYVPIPSEGGHADFAAQHQSELDLINFVRTTEELRCNISWEDLLSGNGIKRIYLFLRSINHYPRTEVTALLEKNSLHPDLVFKYRNDDPCCADVFDLYARFYARAAKNFALETLALAGVYIAGGIAAKNLDLFTRDSFAAEFINCGKQQELLKQVPVTIISNYNVSLYGAAAYLLLENHND